MNENVVLFISPGGSRSEAFLRRVLELPPSAQFKPTACGTDLHSLLEIELELFARILRLHKEWPEKIRFFRSLGGKPPEEIIIVFETVEPVTFTLNDSTASGTIADLVDVLRKEVREHPPDYVKSAMRPHRRTIVNRKICATRARKH